MSITLAEVKHAARLAGLRLSEPELLKFQTELTSILDHIHQLDKMAAEKVLPSERAVIAVSALRNDSVVCSLAVKDVLKNAPSTREGMFNVPKVI